MKRGKLLLQTAAILSGIASCVGIFLNGPVFTLVGVVGVGVATAAQLYQNAKAEPYIKQIGLNDWKHSAVEGFEVVIPLSEHKRGRTPDAKAIIQEGSQRATCMAAIGYDVKTGAVTIGVSRPVELSVEIRA